MKRISRCRPVNFLLVSLTFSSSTFAESASQPAFDFDPVELSPVPHQRHKYWEKDDVARRQEVDTFSTLEDGQPAGPGDWELQLDSGWATGSKQSDAGLLTPAVKYTPHRYGEAPAPFFEHMQLRLTMPFELGNGQIDRNADLNFGVQERWIAEHDGIPSISTLGEIRMPTGRNSGGVDGTFTAIAAKDLGPGTVIVNGWVRSANGDDIEDVRHFQWGLRLGYKWRITDRFAIVTDLVHQSSQQTGHGNNTRLELGAQWHTAHHLSFGPGWFASLDGHDNTPSFGAGLRFIYLFNARDPPP